MAFGKQPREMGIYLDRVEIAACGDLLFARLPGAASAPTLVDELGPAFGPIAGLFSDMRSDVRSRIPVEANWRLAMQISLDDYHLAAVHPRTLGKVGYHKAENLNYYRFGANSAFFSGRDAETLDEMAAAVASGDFRHRGYRIFHLFPAAALLVFRAYGLMGEDYWYVATQTIVPIEPGRCELQVRVARSPYFQPRSRLGRLMEPAESMRRRLVLRGVMRVLDEDRLACEIQQREVRQISARPLYGRPELRVAWFDEEYARVMAGWSSAS
jgi:phenylpropionate dioxygenase-like ring-hydroxylating dioxygenase large terminal subunit